MKHNAIGTYRPNKKGDFKRDEDGKFKKSWFKRLWDGIKFWSMVGGIGYALILVGMFYHKATAVDNIVKIDNLSPKIEELKWKLIEDLKKYETPADNRSLIILDQGDKVPNCPEDKFSLGVLKFKVCTVKTAYKMYYNKDITKQEAIEIAIDEKKSSELAYNMIFNTVKGDKGIGHWFNSSKKDNNNLKGQLATIKNLEK